MRLEQLCERAGENEVARGWRENGGATVGEDIALFHSELSEALECVRDGRGLGEVWYREDGKPEGYLVELADVVIRIAAHVRNHGLTKQFSIALLEKLAFNETRPHRHGGKAL